MKIFKAALLILALSYTNFASAKTNKFGEEVPNPLKAQSLLYFDCLYEPKFLGQKMAGERKLIVYDVANSAMLQAHVDTAIFTRTGLLIMRSRIRDFVDNAESYRYFEEAELSGIFRTLNWDKPKSAMQTFETKWQFLKNTIAFVRHEKNPVFEDEHIFLCSSVSSFESFDAVVDTLN